MKKDKVRVKWIEVSRKSIKPGLRMVCQFPSLSKDSYLGTVETVDWAYKKGDIDDNGHVLLNILVEMPKSNILYGYSCMRGETIPALINKKGKVVIKELPYMKPVSLKPRGAYTLPSRDKEEEEVKTSFKLKKKKKINKEEKVKKSTNTLRLKPKKGSGQ